MRGLLAAILAGAAICVASLAHGEPAQQCVPFEAIANVARARHWQAVELPDLMRARFLARWNASPPPSDDHPDHVWVLSEPGADVVAIVFVNNDGCATEYHIFDVTAFTRAIALPPSI